jgi:8-oxo-dGTP pyrophosphatase MutT (NUDIX family)
MGKMDYDRTVTRRLFDGAARFVFRLGYSTMLLLWRVYKPRHTGVGVLIRHDDQVLAVRHSYRPGYTIPGGGMDRGENPRQTAVRELAEELSINADPDHLVYKRHVYNTHLFELRLAEKPHIRIDHREIVEALFMTPEEATRRTPSFRQFM